jgi:DNA-binding MarR family transcriptional regulator
MNTMAKLSENQIRVLDVLMAQPRNEAPSHILVTFKRASHTITALMRHGLIERVYHNAPIGSELRDWVRVSEKGRQAYACGNFEPELTPKGRV